MIHKCSNDLFAADKIKQEEKTVTSVVSNQSTAMKAFNVPQEIYYSISWRSKRIQVGSHTTKRKGCGTDFCGFSTLLENPDPKRLDVSASLRMQPKQLMVRTFYERSAVNVYAVADLSSSLSFNGITAKHQTVAQLIESIGWSVTRQGDYFGMIACDDALLDEVELPLSHRSTAAQEARVRIEKFFSANNNPRRSASALPVAASRVSTKRALVFLISDFYLSEDLLAKTYRAFEQHDVVPIVLWDPAEFEQWPTWGIARLREMETGAERVYFARPSLQARLQEHVDEQRKVLMRLSQRFGFRSPFFMTNGFDSHALTRHLLGG